jgi:DNA-binding NarL/FixJ family response regulator
MKRLVVVAEDSLIVAAIAIALRTSADFQLVGQLDGRLASAHEIVAASPDVVLIDEMQDSDKAVELIRQVKSERDNIWVIMLTLSADSTRLDAMFDAGARAAVSKAVQPQALPTLIRETINGRILQLHKPIGATQRRSDEPIGDKEWLLSTREREVLELVAAGATNREIARKLWVTEQTVKFHLSNIYRKLDVGNRTEASRYAHVNGLVGARRP